MRRLSCRRASPAWAPWARDASSVAGHAHQPFCCHPLDPLDARAIRAAPRGHDHRDSNRRYKGASSNADRSCHGVSRWCTLCKLVHHIRLVFVRGRDGSAEAGGGGGGGCSSARAGGDARTVAAARGWRRRRGGAAPLLLMMTVMLLLLPLPPASCPHARCHLFTFTLVES